MGIIKPAIFKAASLCLAYQVFCSIWMGLALKTDAKLHVYLLLD
jgi:hypothetical protein